MFTVAAAPLFDFMSEEYAALFDASHATAFQHPIWLDAIYKKLVSQLNAEPLIVTVREAVNDRLVMVLPLLRRRYRRLRVIEFADLGVSDYVMPVVSDVAINAIIADPLVRERVQAILKPFDILRIRKLRTPSMLLERLLGATDCRQMSTGAYAVPLGSDFAAWRANNMSASYCKQLDRKSRQLHRMGKVNFDCVSDVETIKTALLKMQEYRRPRFESGDLLQDPIYFDFYLDVAIRGRSGMARLYSTFMDGVPIASVWGLSHKGSFLVILVGFDHDNYRSQSVGALTFEMIAKHAISVGDCELDFTIGDETYKTLFGAQRSPLYQIIRSGSVPGAIAVAAVRHGPRIKSIARRLVK